MNSRNTRNRKQKRKIQNLTPEERSRRREAARIHIARIRSEESAEQRAERQMRDRVNARRRRELNRRKARVNIHYTEDSSTDMEQYERRERTQNWKQQEKKFLLDLCRKDMRIVDDKRLDASVMVLKNKAWQIIHQKFCSKFGTERTCNRLKEQWRRMKTRTGNEMRNYNKRLDRYGSEVADLKKPSPLAFEVWEFMEEAKKARKSEALDDIDYSQLPLAPEEGNECREEEHVKTEEHHMDDSSSTPPQELCDIDIKEETNDSFNDTHNDSMALGDLVGAFRPEHNMNNISATLEALNAFPSAAAAAPDAATGLNATTLSNGQLFNSTEMKCFMDMQSKEHLMRMKILEVQLQAAKSNFDLVEINKTIALQKQQEYASKHSTS